MVRYIICGVFLLMIHCFSANGQQPLSFDDYMQGVCEEWIENRGDEYEGEGDESLQELIDMLEELHSNPIDLNTTDSASLSRLPFISEQQVSDILAYVRRYGSIRSMGELMAIRSIDYLTRMRLMLFTNVSRVDTYHPTTKRNHFEAMFRTDIPLYTKEGYRDKSSEEMKAHPNGYYQGYNSYNNLRLRFDHADRFRAGLQMEHDAGETGIDYIAAYAQLKNLGPVSKLIVGDYKVSRGMGLTLSNGLSFGKSMQSTNNSVYSNRGITPHTGMSEGKRMRGIAAELNLWNTFERKILLTAWASYRKTDGTLRTDTNAISSLKTDGLHRTNLEKSKKGNLSETSLGGSIEYIQSGFRIGANATYTHLSIPLLPKSNTPSTEYRKTSLHGTDFSAFSAYYSYLSRQFSLTGETAVTGIGSIATVNQLTLPLNSYTNLRAIHRYYAKDYATMYGRSFGEGSNTQNEHGLYLGLSTILSSQVRVEAYADGFYFPWKRYGADAGSKGIDALIRVDYTPNERTSFICKYKIKTKQADCRLSEHIDTTSLCYFTNQTIRLQWKQQVGNHFTFKTSANMLFAFDPTADMEHGLLLSEQVGWTDIQKKRKLNLLFAWFNTDSYASRLYDYEPTLPYAMGMSAYAWHGIRTCITGSTPIMRNIFLSFRASSTIYFNRDTIGTALELIDANHKEDIQVCLSWKL